MAPSTSTLVAPAGLERLPARVSRSAIVALVTIAACTSPPESFERVALRLRCGDFGQPVSAHGPMMAIGNTAREVVALPDRVPISEIAGAMFDGDVARIDVDLRPRPPESRIELDVMAVGLPALLTAEVRDALAARGRAVRLDDGWTLEPLAGRRARLTVQASAARAAIPEEQEHRQIVAQLFARAPIPRRLTSRPFSLSGGESIEIAYGLIDSRSPSPEVRLSARLYCDGKKFSLLDATVAPGRDPPGWRVQRSERSSVAGTCTLELRQENADGKPSAFVVWGAPEIWAPADTRELRVVLISLDTLRADHMSGYGYPRRTTPEIDRRLLDRGARFEDAMTTVASTGTAHLSLFTGLFPLDQRTRGRLGRADATVTLAERLQDAGFATAAFTEDGLVAGPFGFWFGFDLFREYHVVSDERGARVFRDGIDYLRSHRDRRFFLFLHTYKVHDPWEPAAATADLFRDGDDWEDGTLDPRIPEEQRPFVDAYDRTIVEADRIVAGFLDELEQLDLADRTLVVLLSDHGEAFGEHVVVGHGLGVGQEQLQIPLVFRGPGVARGVVRRAPVGITDVAATILDLAGLDHGDLGSGRSLADLVRAGSASGDGSLPARPLFFTRLLGQGDGVRSGSTKVMKTGHECTTWNLSEDPGEDQPRVVPCERADLAAEIDSHRARAEAERRESAPATNDAPSIPGDTMESLRALGYVD